MNLSLSTAETIIWDYMLRKKKKLRRLEKCRDLENNLQKESSQVGFVNPRATKILLIAPIPHSVKGPFTFSLPEGHSVTGKKFFATEEK